MYTTLAQVRDAYAAGDIPPDAKLVVDNDCSYLCFGGDQYYAGPGPEALAMEALALLGIPSERA